MKSLVKLGKPIVTIVTLSYKSLFVNVLSGDDTSKNNRHSIVTRL